MTTGRMHALSRRIALVTLVVTLLAVPGGALPAQMLRYADLTAAAIARLDRGRTVLVIPGGIIEEHGPLLPVSADAARNERLAADLAATIAARPGWTVVILPTVPLGSGSFERIAGRPGFPGSIPVRASTVQAVFTDMADAIGAQGFRWVFIVNGHGEPNHNRALDLAGDYFHDTYHGVMVHLLGRRGCQADGLGAPPLALLDSAAMRADADSPHAGAQETSRTWYLRPDLVASAAVRRARDVTAGDPAAWKAAGRAPDWPGYVGAPRFASLALGRWVYEREARQCGALALRLLDGLDERSVPRYADEMRSIPPLRAMLDADLRAEAAQGARQARWQAAAPKRP